MLELHTREHGYLEMIPPFMVNADSMFGTGQLPKFEHDSFKTEPGGFLPRPDRGGAGHERTTPKEILGARSDLPRAYCAYTPCFRSEAGSYGKDVRGLDPAAPVQQGRAGPLLPSQRQSYEQLELLTSPRRGGTQASGASLPGRDAVHR